jgi:hypothetical protein
MFRDLGMFRDPGMLHGLGMLHDLGIFHDVGMAGAPPVWRSRPPRAAPVPDFSMLIMDHPTLGGARTPGVEVRHLGLSEVRNPCQRCSRIDAWIPLTSSPDL